MTKPKTAAMSKPLDAVEREYEQAILRAQDDDTRYELSVGLRQYRQMFKAGDSEAEEP